MSVPAGRSSGRRRHRRAVGTLLGLAVVAGAGEAPSDLSVVAALAATAGSAASSFSETFDGTPTSPEPWNAPEWDIVQTSRERETWASPVPVSAHHSGSTCGDVDAGGEHMVESWPDTVFRCSDHVMTSIDGAEGYAAIFLSPPSMADFSAGAATVSFDVSTFVSSTRDWLDVTITPFDDLMSYPFRSDIVVDGDGLPHNAIHIEQSFGGKEWLIEVVRNDVIEDVGTLEIPYEGFGGASRTVRTPIAIVVDAGSVTMSYPTVPGASVTVPFAELSWRMGVVQFGHHSYNPRKGCESAPDLICQPDTWHWDNVSISPARPIYQRQATPERTGAPIEDEEVREVSFAEPAPDGASLFFTGNCGVEVRHGTSEPWQPATIYRDDHPEHTHSYRVAVPAGQSSLEYRFVADGWYNPGFGCQLSNPIVKSLEADGAR